jgi:hypothetical protein
VAYFAGRAACTTSKLAIDNNAAANAGADENTDHISAAAPNAVMIFTKHRDLDIIIQKYR